MTVYFIQVSLLRLGMDTLFLIFGIWMCTAVFVQKDLFFIFFTIQREHQHLQDLYLKYMSS